jgi:hypothetical protein
VINIARSSAPGELGRAASSDDVGLVVEAADLACRALARLVWRAARAGTPLQIEEEHGGRIAR